MKYSMTSSDVQVQRYSQQAAAQPNVHKTESRRDQGAYVDISIGCLVISIPMVVLTALLLGLIYSNEVKKGPYVEPIASFDNTQQSSSAYLVDFSSTRLLTVASLSSSVAPFLPGFVMLLLSFPVARRLSSTSEARQNTRLPTPYQLALYLQFLTAGLSSIYQWIKYRMWKKREKQVPVITTLATGLTVVTLLG